MIKKVHINMRPILDGRETPRINTEHLHLLGCYAMLTGK